MKSITDRLKGVAWYKWVLAACLFFYLIYLSISYLYLPGKLKNLTESDVSKMIGREITVGDIRFNPFYLSLTVRDFSVSDTPEDPLIEWDQLLVNFSLWRSLFSWEIAYSEISLDNPYINIVKLKKGFNFSEIIENLSKSDSDTADAPEKTGEKSSIAIEIFNTSINTGSFKYTDKSGNVPAVANLNDISLVIKELYFATGDEHLNSFNIDAKSQRGGEILLRGNYRIDPLYVEGNIGAKGVNMPALSKFLENIVPLKLSSGMLSFNTDILVKKDNVFILKTDRGSLSIDDLVLDDSVPEPSMMSAGNINVQDFSLDLAGRKVTVEKVLLDKITANQWIDENGGLRYKAILAEKLNDAVENEKPPVDTEEAEQPWDLMIRQVSLKNSTFNFEDLNEEITRGHSLSAVNLDVRDISLAPESKMLLELAALVDEKGAIDVDGSLSLSPFSMELNYHLDKILLNPFSEYLEAASWLTLADGSLSVQGKAAISEGTETTIRADASLGVDDFKLKDSRSGKPVFGLKAFKLDDIKAEVDKQSVSIASVSISKPDFNLNMSDKKEFNLSGLIKENKVEAVPDSPAEASNKSPEWKYEIEKVSMSEGTLLFSDNSIKPVYKTGLYNMTFSLDKIGSDIKEPAPFSFKTEIDKYAPFTVKGSLDPIDRQPGFAFNSMLKGLDMSHLSPYSGVYIGSNLKSGKLSLNLDYALHDRKLKGKNNINAKNLYLGEKLPVEPVINAPVGLGLALLRDISGVIDLDVGVSGDLDDPGFSVSGVIVKALVNIIVKAAASPFKLLGALVPGGGDDLGNITFDPGYSTLNQENKNSLKNLVDALNKRPQLMLSIKGNASGPEDIEALKIANLKQKVAEKRGVSLSVVDEELNIQDIWMAAENRSALEAINNEMGLSAVTERIEKMRSQASQEQTEDSQESVTQDEASIEQAVFKQVYEEILKTTKIDESELISLADERALSIKQYLVEDLKLSHERVSVIKALNSDLSGRVISLELDVM